MKEAYCKLNPTRSESLTTCRHPFSSAVRYCFVWYNPSSSRPDWLDETANTVITLREEETALNVTMGESFLSEYSMSNSDSCSRTFSSKSLIAQRSWLPEYLPFLRRLRLKQYSDPLPRHGGAVVVYCENFSNFTVRK